MKKAITTTVLILSLSAGLSTSQVMAAPQADAKTGQESAKQDWREVLAAQVALAKAKVLLLQARSELWLTQNREATLKSLDEARASLDDAWRSADQVTRPRIEELKLEIDQAKLLIQEKRQSAEAELYAIVKRTDSTLNSVLAKTQTKNRLMKEEITSRYALVQANAAALKAQVALEIEQSPEKAEQALKEAEEALLRAKESASHTKAIQIAKLREQAHVAKQSVNNEVDNAKAHISALVVATDAQLKRYEQTLQESDEAKRLKKRYVHLEAQAALLNAQLATKLDSTSKQAAAYLSESKAWYESLKTEAETRGEQELAKMSAGIEEAKQAVQRKDKQARAKLAELLEQAAEMVND